MPRRFNWALKHLAQNMGKQLSSTATLNWKQAEQSFETLHFSCRDTDQQEKELVKSISLICSATFPNAGHEAGTYFAILSLAYKMWCTFALVWNTVAFLNQKF